MPNNIISKFKHFSYRLKSNKTKFTEIYSQKGFAGDSYPASGIGSTLEQTKIIRQRLPLIFREYDISSFVDVPCGDFTWMAKVNLDGMQYYGFDIVKSVVEKNRSLYEKNNIHFNELDVVAAIVPVSADMIFCRDCLVHLSNRDTLKALRNFKKSGSTYLLTTTFSELKENVDLVSGRGWRPLNLERHPFCFPPPIKLIHERSLEEDEKYTDKCLGLWKLKELHAL